jgi:hypothetical protein
MEGNRPMKAWLGIGLMMAVCACTPHLDYGAAMGPARAPSGEVTNLPAFGSPDVHFAFQNPLVLDVSVAVQLATPPIGP